MAGILRDLEIRTGGVMLIVLGALAIRSACGCLGVAEYGLCAVAFPAISLGAFLLLLGRHIFDQVPISSRWASRS